MPSVTGTIIFCECSPGDARPTLLLVEMPPLALPNDTVVDWAATPNDTGVDWAAEGQTTGHPYIGQRVAVLHDGTIVRTKPY